MFPTFRKMDLRSLPATDATSGNTLLVRIFHHHLQKAILLVNDAGVGKLKLKPQIVLV